MSAKVIGTHSGTFHCDEALACFMLKQLPEYKDSTIVRSRDPKELEKCDIVVDVGGVYDHGKCLYDHHQRGFEETFSGEYNTKLSSAGLIYKHYGKKVISVILDIEESSKQAEFLFQHVYKKFIEGVDAIDNGKSKYPADIKPAYEESTGLSARVSRLNPWWNQPKETIDTMAQFKKAVELTGSEFSERVRYYGKAWLPARDIVSGAFTNRFNVHESGKIILFDQFCPWKEHIFDLESEAKISNDDLPYYAIYEDESGNWRVQAIPESPDSFATRKPLPQEWRGIRDDALSELSGIKDCIFVHAAGFIGGNKTKEGAIAMALKSI
ncbi:hypothetical protein H4219_003674 [Mycoemilia scoparia]|uniref:Metal-dependent protein hydrolase n=1 Tax=Mycoemilia scoparia TaxID=417184 RepID=A0A9W8A3J9_9FUNG|nr:hypothetical protein H4219_003674 [Mycoemilia scoparia]